jgi:hypothetical protein
MKDIQFSGNGARSETADSSQFGRAMAFLTVTDLNDFNARAQTTNLGVRSSNLFGRAKLPPFDTKQRSMRRST